MIIYTSGKQETGDTKMNTIFTNEFIGKDSIGGILPNSSIEAGSFESISFSTHFSDSGLTSYLMTEWNDFQSKNL